MRKILIVGQIPPPYHGQSIMIEQMLKTFVSFKEISFVKMKFSKDIKNVGKFEIQKIFELVVLIFKILYFAIFRGCDTLYFPPTGGSNKIPFYRDTILLILTRFCFKKTIFHFHAWGLHELYASLNSIERILFKLAYNKPDISIIMTEKGSNDPNFIMSKDIKIIPNGLKDAYLENLAYSHTITKLNNEVNILYVGILKESKGVNTLLSAIAMLNIKGHKIKATILGEFESKEYESKVQEYVLENNISDIVEFVGSKTGLEKDMYFRQSDIFCFPTYYECENFPNVLIEAMMYSLPVVSTDWRGVSSLIKNSENGILCKIHSPECISESLEKLILNKDIREKMGEMGRKRYTLYFTDSVFSENILNTFSNV